MSKAKPLKLGMVACGGISHAHGIAARENSGRVRFVACCDVVEDRAKDWAKEYGCDNSYTDYNEMFAKEQLDAVVLATWPNQHRQQIEDCLKAGQTKILCEKALTVTGQEAAEVFDLVKEHGAFLMEGFMYRHHPAIRRMQQLVAAGEIGEVDCVRACFSDLDAEEEPADDPDRNWRRDKARAGGIPWDFACYCVNCCRLFADGVPVRVRTFGGHSAKYDTVNRVYTIVQYDNGRVGFIESSKSAAFKQDVEVTGSKAVLHLPVGWTILDEINITRRFASGWAQLLSDTFVIPGVNSFVPQMRNFADVIEGKAKPLLPLAETAVNCYTIEALVKSLEENREVELEIPERIVKALKETTK